MKRDRRRLFRVGWAITALVAAGLMSGCSGPRGQLVLDPVGPERPRDSQSRGQGQLQVFSVTESKQSGRITFHQRTPYWVYDNAGKRVESVINRTGYTDESAARIDLPAGQYRVIARAEGYGLVTVPVVIEGNRLTQVWLDGVPPRALRSVDTNRVVFLPGGSAVGYRAVSRPQ